MRILENW